MYCRILCAATAIVTAACAARGDFIEAGRVLPEKRDVHLRLLIGNVTKMEGMVEETHRKLYDVTGSYWKQDTREKYDLNDFSMDGSYPAVGWAIDVAGKWFTFEYESLWMNPKTTTTARRDYYIGVGSDIEYNGASYDHMMIPKGSEFSMHMVGGTTDLRLLFTPVTIKPVETLAISPWVCAGLFLFLGTYDIDAGSPRGTMQYQNPPENFVVGGKSDGILALGLPEWGYGLEMRIGGPDSVNVVLHGGLVETQYSGSSKFLTSSAERSKNVDLDHTHMKFRLMFEFPVSGGQCFTVGAQMTLIESTGDITASATTPEEILATQERFDKHVSFVMESTVLMVGMTF